MKILGKLSLLCLPLFLTGCYTYYAPVIPPQGLLFSNVSAPIDTDAEATPVSSKSGEASAMSILWLFSFGDASTATAAQDANIQRIDHIDYEYLNVLGFYQRFTTVVRGE